MKAEKFAGMLPEKEFEERSRTRRPGGTSPETCPERKLWATLRTWRLVKLDKAGGRAPER